MDLGLTPPPSVEKIHTFYFFFEGFPNLNLKGHEGESINSPLEKCDMGYQAIWVFPHTSLVNIHYCNFQVLLACLLACESSHSNVKCETQTSLLYDSPFSEKLKELVSLRGQFMHNSMWN